MRRLAWLVLMSMTTIVNAEVYKCTDKSGKVLYQSQSCGSNSKQSQLDIASDPDTEAKAQAQLQSIRETYELEKANQRQAEKEANERLEKAAQLEFARRSALAAQKQAEAQQRQAAALERQKAVDHYHPLWLPPPHTMMPPPPARPSEPPPMDRKPWQRR